MKLNICSIFRDDPSAKIKPAPKPNVEMGEDIVIVADEYKSTEFCKCDKKCEWMKNPKERVCCKNNKFCEKMPGDTCVTSHPDFDAILNKVTLNGKCNFCILQFF